MMHVFKKELRVYLKCSRQGSLKIIKRAFHRLDQKQLRGRLGQFIMQFKQKERITKIDSCFPFQTFKSPKLSCLVLISVAALQQQVVLIVGWQFQLLGAKTTV